MIRLLAWEKQLLQFMFPVEGDMWLAVFRIVLGVEVTTYALFLRNDWNDIFAGTGSGLVSRELQEAIISFESPLIPQLGWLVALGSRRGIGEQTILSLAWAGLLCVGCFLLVGIFCRPAAMVAWFLHLCAAESGGLLTYGVDNFMTIGLFYLMLSPLPDRYSLDWRLWKPKPKNPQLLGFWRRILQLHLCLAYFFGGVGKCLGIGWWNGSNLWRALTRPPFNVVSPDILVRCKDVLPALGVLICMIEVGYILFIWIKKTQLLWLVFVLGMHAGIGMAMGLYLFAIIMIVLNIAAFGPNIAIAQNRRLTRAEIRTSRISNARSLPLTLPCRF